MHFWLPEGRGFRICRGCFLTSNDTTYWKWWFSFACYKYQTLLYAITSTMTSTRIPSFNLIVLVNIVRSSWLPNSYFFDTTWTAFRQITWYLSEPSCYKYGSKINYVLECWLVNYVVNALIWPFLVSYQLLGQDFQDSRYCFRHLENFSIEDLCWCRSGVIPSPTSFSELSIHLSRHIP